MSGIDATFRTAGDDEWLTIRVADAAAFEAMREALGDPVWLVGATWEILTTNEYKRGRFDDAFGAFAERQDGIALADRLAAAGVDAEHCIGEPPSR